MESGIFLKKLIPVLVVDKIEPCLPFWLNRLEFELAAEIREGDELTFARLAKDNVLIAYISQAGLADEAPALAGLRVSAGLYIEVAQLEPIAQTLEGADIVMPLRKTSYGFEEIAVREPGGNIVCFAAH
jgi:hypothetical protein